MERFSARVKSIVEFLKIHLCYDELDDEYRKYADEYLEKVKDSLKAYNGVYSQGRLRLGNKITFFYLKAEIVVNEDNMFAKKIMERRLTNHNVAKTIVFFV